MSAPAPDSVADRAITTSRLVKKYGLTAVVDGIDLDVRVGDRYGFLGPNGSGKTTTVRLLLGLVFATSGAISVLGQRIPRRTQSVLRDVGALVEGPAFYDHLSARANLSLFDAAGKGGSPRDRRERISTTLERVGLASVGRKHVGAYSLGMRGRLGLAAALLRAPRLLVLDEPTNGLDPQGIAEIRNLLVDLNEQEGTTLFVSSHLLAEVEAMCTRVGVLDRGRLVLQGDLATLCGPTGRVVVTTPDADRVPALLGQAVVGRDGDRVTVDGLSAPEVANRLVGAGLRLGELMGERIRLEDLVLAHTGSGSDRADAVEREWRLLPGERQVTAEPEAERADDTSATADQAATGAADARAPEAPEDGAEASPAAPPPASQPRVEVPAEESDVPPPPPTEPPREAT